MRAAIAHKIRPSALILGKDSHKPWTRTDIVLAKAFQRFEEETCKQCGLPRYICHSDDNRIQFKTFKDECAATAMAEREQESLAKTKNYGVRIGADPYLTDDAIADGMEMSDFRRPYMLDRAKKMGLIPEDAEFIIG